MKNFNMQKLLQQAQKMQEALAKKQEELAAKRFEAASGGGMVTAVVNGKGGLLSVKIDPTIVDPKDVDMLQDLVVAAVNEASRQAQEEAKGLLGGMLGPGMPDLNSLL